MIKLAQRALLFLTFILASASALTQDEAPSEQATQKSESVPYEVVVTPMMSRGNLRSLIIEVEDDFYAKFNELNLDDNYDIACYTHEPTMSHINRRVCEPWFMLKARSNNAGQTMYRFATNYATGPWGGFTGTGSAPVTLSPQAMRKEMEQEYQELQKRMEVFTAEDQSFREIGSVLAQLRYRLRNFGKED